MTTSTANVIDLMKANIAEILPVTYIEEDKAIWAEINKGGRKGAGHESLCLKFADNASAELHLHTVNSQVSAYGQHYSSDTDKVVIDFSGKSPEDAAAAITAKIVELPSNILRGKYEASLGAPQPSTM